MSQLAVLSPLASRVRRLSQARVRPSARAMTVAAAVCIGLLYVVLAKVLFTGLGFYDVYDYDEARHAVNAYEMLQRGDLLGNTYRGALDYWNLKPPLSFWVIEASYSAFGYTPFALRLPSALASVGTVALITLSGWRWFGRGAAVISTAAAVSCLILLGAHTGRTGDPDAVFILFMTGSVLCALEARRRPYLLVASTTLFSAAFLTKSFHAVLALVFLGAILVLRRGSRLRLRHVLVALVGFLPVVVWAIARWTYDGLTFLSQMVTYDLLNRGSTAIEGHAQPRDYYFGLLQGTFQPFLVLLVAALVLVLSSRDLLGLRRMIAAPSVRTVTAAGLAAWTGLVFGAFTVASTKLPWYIASGMPTLCILIGAIVAAALRMRRHAASIVLVVLLVWAVGSGQSLLRAVRTAEVPVVTQLALAGLDRAPALRHDDAFLDASLSEDQTSTSWPQSLVAVAQWSGDLVPSDAGASGYERASAGRAVLLTRADAPAARSALRDGGRIVSQNGDVVVIAND